MKLEKFYINKGLYSRSLKSNAEIKKNLLEFFTYIFSDTSYKIDVLDKHDAENLPEGVKVDRYRITVNGYPIAVEDVGHDFLYLISEKSSTYFTSMDVPKVKIKFNTEVDTKAKRQVLSYKIVELIEKFQIRDAAQIKKNNSMIEAKNLAERLQAKLQKSSRKDKITVFSYLTGIRICSVESIKHTEHYSSPLWEMILNDDKKEIRINKSLPNYNPNESISLYRKYLKDYDALLEQIECETNDAHLFYLNNR